MFNDAFNNCVQMKHFRFDLSIKIIDSGAFFTFLVEEVGKNDSLMIRLRIGRFFKR